MAGDNVSKDSSKQRTSPETPLPLQAPQDGIAPELPPPMASVRSHTADEIVQMMNKTPLFMTSLEDDEGKR